MWGKVFQERVKKNLQLFCFQKLAFLGVKIPKIPAHLFVTGSDAPYSPTSEAASRWVTWSLSWVDACRFIFLNSLNSINLRNLKPLGSFISKVSTKALLCGQTHKAANVFLNWWYERSMRRHLIIYKNWKMFNFANCYFTCTKINLN